MTPEPRFLNNAGTSYPKPPPVLEAIARTLATAPSSYGSVFERARARVARELGARPERVLLTTSCTQALEVVLSDLPWSAGDAVVTSRLEHHAVLRPLLALAAHRGVQHRRLSYRPGEPIDLKELSAYLSAGDVRLVVVSTASNVTGEVLPVAEVAEVAHRHGALVLADAAQTFGLMEADVGRLGVDLLTFAGHKYPLGPQGIGGVWVAPHVRFDGFEAACELLPAGAAPSGPEPAPLPDYCQVGGVNVAGLAGLAAGLDAWGNERRERMERARAFAAQFALEARKIPGVVVFGHAGAAQTAVVSLRHEALALERAEPYFAARGLSVRAAKHCAPDALDAMGAEAGTVRVSFGPHNVDSDAEAALSALAAV